MAQNGLLMRPCPLIVMMTSTVKNKLIKSSLYFEIPFGLKNINSLSRVIEVYYLTSNQSVFLHYPIFLRILFLTLVYDFNRLAVLRMVVMHIIVCITWLTVFAHLRFSSYFFQISMIFVFDYLFKIIFLLSYCYLTD